MLYDMINVVCCENRFQTCIRRLIVDSTYLFKWIEAVIPPMTFLLVLWALLETRYSQRTTTLAAAGFLIVELSVQGLILTLGDSPELVFTLLPLTFFLPAIVCLHLLSKKRFFPTVLTWLLALLCHHLLMALQKLPIFLQTDVKNPYLEWFWDVVLALAAGLLLVLVFRYLRTPFMACTWNIEGNWPTLLFLPLMLLSLYSYFLSSTSNLVVLILLFLTAMAAFLMLFRLIVSLAEEQRTRDAGLQIKTLRRNYEILQKKLELGRGYRHDMRHHLIALSALLQEGKYSEAQRYLADWKGQLTLIETENWCRNAAINGVLSSYLAQAKETGCTTDVTVTIPEELPFEEVDLCVVLANTLENAINACEAAPEGAPRNIKLVMTLTDQRRLAINAENSCYKSVEFDDEGFPVVPHRKGHGQGLKSIAAVAEKYHGLFQCGYNQNVFSLRVVLLQAATNPPKKRWATKVYAGIFLCLFLLNCMPNLSSALESIPLLGVIVRMVDLNNYSIRWGSSGITVQNPVLDDSGKAVNKLNEQKQEFISNMQENFIWYVSRKYQGYVAEDITYDTVRDDGSLFTLRFNATLNAGGSVDYSRYISLDKTSGQILELADLFQPESDYVFPISREIKAQMAEQVNAGEADYFLSGGIWPDEECFQSIDENQNFYINENGQLVIVFAEYEVAPGSMGNPEFIIPSDMLDGILAQPSALK